MAVSPRFITMKRPANARGAADETAGNAENGETIPPVPDASALADAGMDAAASVPSADGLPDSVE